VPVVVVVSATGTDRFAEEPMMYALDDELADLRRGLFMDVVKDLHHSI
jgi:hypothetical protein